MRKSGGAALRTFAAPFPDPLLTREELAARLGFSPHTIRKWLREGLPIAQPGRKWSRVRTPRFLEADVRDWLVEFEASRKKPTKNPAEEAAALATWRREMSVEKARGPVLPAVAPAVRRWMARVGVPLRATAALWGPP